MTHGAVVARPRLSRQARRNIEGWLFASPWIIGFILFTLGPMLASAVMAFMTVAKAAVGEPGLASLPRVRSTNQTPDVAAQTS